MPEAADVINLGFLTDSERELILEVLRRDENLRQAEEQRVRKLKAELLDVKRKGAKRGSGQYSRHSCGRCLEPLGWLAAGSGQCKACKHLVCHHCRTGQPSGSWLCSVCAKEVDFKKTTGDWFYNQRVNRYSAKPGHDLVKASLKKRPPPTKHETAGETLLRSSEIIGDALPVLRPRRGNKKDGAPTETSGAVGAKDVCETMEHHSDTESADKASMCSTGSKMDSSGATPDSVRRETTRVRSSPAGSSVSNMSVPIKEDCASIHSSSLDTSDAERVGLRQEIIDSDIDRIFKKSIKHGPKPQEHTSTLDLREQKGRAIEATIGKRSRSVPGLDVQDDDEDEDIDILVNLHKKTVASGSSSLYGSKSTLGSQLSIYSEAGDYDSVEVSGDIVFSLSYDEHTQSLQVFIKECHGLAYGDASRKSSNPYVKCYLLPDRSRQGKRKTTIKRHTVSPIYRETLKYVASRPQLQTCSLLLAVWHHGRITRNVFLGEVELPLGCRELDATQEECVALVGKAASPVEASVFSQRKGELVISLKYVTPKSPTADTVKNKSIFRGKKAKAEEGGELHVLIKEAKSLVAMKAGGTSDSFVKGYLLPAKTAKSKTPVVSKSLNPHYDHTFVYKELSLERLKDMCLELTVWDREVMASNEFLGGVRLSAGTGTLRVGKQDVEMDSVGEEVSLWQKMMQYPDSWAEGTLPLRSSMGKGKDK